MNKILDNIGFYDFWGIFAPDADSYREIVNDFDNVMLIPGKYE